MKLKTLVAVLCAFFLLAAAAVYAAPGKPKTVIHVITVKWKASATPQQISAVLKAAEDMNYPGLKNVWTRAFKMQLPEGYKNIIVMEFASEDALVKYKDSPAQLKWYEVYMPIREESSTHDISN
ncbi:MAG: Dabb family protein [Bryobacteraceae bacterium]|nr:Dabb family protein [Bryobacteraceae bacterium]